MRFECVLLRRHARIFSKSIQCLAKIGDDVVIETLHDRLILRTLASSQSAYAQFAFLSNGAFQKFEHYYEDEEMASQLSNHALNPGFKLKISLKVFLFACKNSMNPYTDKMELTLSNVDNQCTCTLFQEATGMKRIYKFPYEALDNILQADFSSSSARHHLTIKSSQFHFLFSKYFTHSASNSAELTIQCFPECIKLKAHSNYDENAAHPNIHDLAQPHATSQKERAGTKAPVQAESAIAKEDLFFYAVEPSPAYVNGHPLITFSSRELSVFLAFLESEAVSVPLNLRFSQPAAPLLLEANVTLTNAGQPQAPPGWEGQIVVATLQDANFQPQLFQTDSSQDMKQQEGYSQQQQQQQQQQQAQLQPQQSPTQSSPAQTYGHPANQSQRDPANNVGILYTGSMDDESQNTATSSLSIDLNPPPRR